MPIAVILVLGIPRGHILGRKLEIVVNRRVTGEPQRVDPRTPCSDRSSAHPNVEAVADVERLEARAPGKDGRQPVVAERVGEELKRAQPAHGGDGHGFLVDVLGVPLAEPVLAQPEAPEARAGAADGLARPRVNVGAERQLQLLQQGEARDGEPEPPVDDPVAGDDPEALQRGRPVTNRSQKDLVRNRSRLGS